MRHFKHFMFLVMVGSLLIITACSSNDDGDAQTKSSGGEEFVTAKIEGADFVASTNPASLIGAVLSNGILAVQGSTNSGDYIRFNIVNYNGAGTYQTGDAITNPNLIQYGKIDPVVAWLSNGIAASGNSAAIGTITITSDDGVTVEGTFSFTGLNSSDLSTKVISEGQFKASID